MEKFVKGDVVVVAFPFSDLSNSKKRPALVLSNPDGEDVILCQITSKAVRDSHAITLCGEDFENGKLPVDSNIRPNKLFTAHVSIITGVAGHITSDKYLLVVQKISEIIRQQ